MRKSIYRNKEDSGNLELAILVLIANDLEFAIVADGENLKQSTPLYQFGGANIMRPLMREERSDRLSSDFEQQYAMPQRGIRNLPPQPFEIC